ncbi:unnamed protein product [Symbiodinium sp. CCMP2456]|nr:unnamed protein product [Symbiodinium sp. CCMP2456]
MCGSVGPWLPWLLLFAGPSAHLADEALLEPPQIGAVPRELLGNFGAVVDGLADLLGLDEELRGNLLGLRNEEAEACAVLLLLADQALASPNYAAIGKGGHNPTSRLAYRERADLVFLHPVSTERQAAGRSALAADAEALARGKPAEVLLTAALGREVGASPEEVARWKPTLSSLRRLVESELLMPLRALHECDIPAGGPPGETWALVEEVSRQMVEGNLRQWKFQQGSLQLQHLNEDQLRGWFELGLLEHRREGPAGALSYLTREEDDLELAWATKIGGPSHGFDHEGRCLLPLLCNARHRVVLVEDRHLWPHNAAGRCHLRLLHRLGPPRQPVLHLEPLMAEFRAEALPLLEFQLAVLQHAMLKAESLALPLLLGESFDPSDPAWLPEVKGQPFLKPTLEILVLAPSSGIYEASDSLTRKHDWVQLDEEVTEPLQRWLFEPSSFQKL